MENPTTVNDIHLYAKPLKNELIDLEIFVEIVK